MTSLLALALWVVPSGQLTSETGAPLLRLDTIEGATIKLELDEVSADGVIRGTAGGRPQTVELEDVLRVVPLRSGGRPGPPASPPGLRTIYLADGGLLRGTLLPRGEAARRTLRIDLGQDLIVDLPFEAMAAIRTAAEEQAAPKTELDNRLSDRKAGRDVMILAKADGAVVVSGSLERLGPEGWEFRFGSRSLFGALGKGYPAPPQAEAGHRRAYAFILGAAPVAGPRLPAAVLTVRGDRFTASLISADRQRLRVDAGPLGPLILPWALVRMIELKSPRLVYLSDLEPTEAIQRSLPGSRWRTRRDLNVTGSAIRLAGRTYARGLGVHAYSALSYNLARGYERFLATAGIDDAVAPHGSVIFRVKIDGRVAFETPMLRGGDAPAVISVDVRGGDVLTLECDVGDELDLSDHADWADARLLRIKNGASR